MNWHARYTQQAKWTRDLRVYIFNKINLAESSRILEVGCGTGAILSELPKQINLHGLDLNPAALAECRVHAPAAALIRGNALTLPYSDNSFDIVYCHFLLLWVDDPLQALREMKRVVKTGGHILAFAEPDYSSRIDQPGELIPLGKWQTEALIKQGASPNLGAELAELFFQAGIKILETGTIQSVENEPSLAEWELEWTVLEADLEESVADAEIQKMKSIDQQAWARGERLLNVPTYFAWGQI